MGNSPGGTDTPVGLAPEFSWLPRHRWHRRGQVLSQSLPGVMVPAPPSAPHSLSAGSPVPPERGAGAEPGAGAAPGLPLAAGSPAHRAPRDQALQAGCPGPGHQLHRPPQPHAGPRAPPPPTLKPAPWTPAPAPSEGETQAPQRGAQCPGAGPWAPHGSSQSPVSPTIPSACCRQLLASPAQASAHCLAAAPPWGPRCATSPHPPSPAVGHWLDHRPPPNPSPLLLLQKWPMRSHLYTGPWGGPGPDPPGAASASSSQELRGLGDKGLAAGDGPP